LGYAAEGSLSDGVYLITEYSVDTGTTWHSLDHQGDSFDDDRYQWFTHILPPVCENTEQLWIRWRIRNSGSSECADVDNVTVIDLPEPTVGWTLYANHFEPEEGNSTADICFNETLALFDNQGDDLDVCLALGAQYPASAGNQGLLLVDNNPTAVEASQIDTRWVPTGSDLVCSFAMAPYNLGPDNYANAWYRYDGINYLRMNGMSNAGQTDYDWFRFKWEPGALGNPDVSVAFFIPLSAGVMSTGNGIMVDDFELNWYRASHDLIGLFSDLGDGTYSANLQSDLAGTANVSCIYYGSDPPLQTDGLGDNSAAFPVTFFE